MEKMDSHRWPVNPSKFQRFYPKILGPMADFRVKQTCKTGEKLLGETEVYEQVNGNACISG